MTEDNHHCGHPGQGRRTIEGTDMCQECQRSHEEITLDAVDLTLNAGADVDLESLTRHVSAEVAELLRHGPQCPCLRCAERRRNAWMHRDLVTGLEEAIIEGKADTGPRPEKPEKEEQE